MTTSTTDTPGGDGRGLLDLAPLPIDLARLPAPGSLPAVLDGHVHVAHLPGLLDSTYCDAVMSALSDVSFNAYEVEGVCTTEMLKIGPTAHYQFDEGDGLDRYFDEAASADADLRARFVRAGIVDPLDIILGILRHLWGGPVEVALEGDRRYFAGVVRSVTGGTDPHIDNARRTPHLSIGKTVSQGSILLYLRMPPAGGGVKVFHKRPESPLPFDGLGWRGVAGLTYSGVTPRAGDVVILPSTFLHSVEPVLEGGERVTISTFFGPMPDGRLVVWS